MLGWRPEEFWSATPLELTRSLPGGPDFAGMSTDDLAALRSRFPDLGETSDG